MDGCGQDFDTTEDRDEERRDSISVLGCQGLPVAVMVVRGHRDRRQTGGVGARSQTFFYLSPKQSLQHLLITVVTMVKYFQRY